MRFECDNDEGFGGHAAGRPFGGVRVNRRVQKHETLEERGECKLRRWSYR